MVVVATKPSLLGGGLGPDVLACTKWLILTFQLGDLRVYACLTRWQFRMTGEKEAFCKEWDLLLCR